MKEWNIIISKADAPPPQTFAEVLQHLPNHAFAKWFSIPQAYLIAYVVILHYGKPVGRLCLYQNSFIDGGKTLLFGSLCCEDDDETFQQLMQAVIHYAKNNGYTSITGPVDGSTWEAYRLPVSNYGLKFFTDLPQPEYYARHLQQAGFVISHRYHTYISPVEPKVSASALLQQTKEAGILLRPLDLKNYEAELEKLYPFCNKAFANNVLFSPISKEDFLQKYHRWKPWLQAGYTWLAEDAAGTLQAFVSCLPDSVRDDRLVMKTIARNIHNRQSAGLVRLLADEIYNSAYRAGFKHMLHAFMHSSNQSKILSGNYNGQVFKEYALFTKTVLP